MSDDQRFHVLTGGPGSGKSTLLSALSSEGFPVFEEAGRAIIKHQMRMSGPALPWTDPALFAEAMFARDLQSYRSACGERGPVFFDRGLLDVLGYLRLMSLPVPAHMSEAASAHPYNRRVFIAPPWPEIFAQDDERKQSPDEAERTYRMMVRIYGEYGYDLVELPRVSVADRVAFVLGAIGRT